MKRMVSVMALVMLVLAGPVFGLNPGTELFVPAAARGAGSGGSLWVTDLYVVNPGAESVDVTLYWLERNADNSGAEGVTYTLGGGKTLSLPDVISSVFGLDAAGGAIRIVATGPVTASARIFNQGESSTFGQGFEGVPATAALSAGSSTDVAALADNGAFRTNLFAVNTGDGPATVEISLHGADGTVLATKRYELEPYAALYRNISDLGAGSFDEATLHAEAVAGTFIVVASKVDNASGDPTTLEAWWSCGGSEPSGPGGKYIGNVYNADGYIRGGITVFVDDSGAVTYLGWRTEPRSTCIDLDMPGWEDLSVEPVPVAEFAGGHTVHNDYTSWGSTFGTIDWVITMTWRGENQSLEGTITATGAGFGGPTLSCLNAEGDVHTFVAAKLLPPEGS